MPAQTQARSIDTVVVGGGQAGLAVAYHLRRLRREHVVLEAEKRIGDSWRRRWDSLRLFSPARYDALPGRRFPAPSGAFPTKDQVAEYLESYREHFELPVETGTRVTRLSKVEGRFLVEADAKSWVCRNVVVATSSFRTPHVPAFASRLDPGINQLTPKEYRNPGQLLDGTVLVVGASDTGVELALEAAASHPTVLAGKHPGHIPFRIEGVFGRAFGVPVVIGILFHYVLSVDTPIGRKVRPKMLGHAGPNVRFKPRDVAAAGVRRVGRVAGARDGLPVLQDGTALAASNILWCTGFAPDFSWIDLPVFTGEGKMMQPLHDRGVVHTEPGLYFVGLFFLRSLSSSLLRGVSRDARYVAEAIARRAA